MSQTDCVKFCVGNYYAEQRCSNCKTQNFHLDFILRVVDGDMELERTFIADPWCSTCDDNADLEQIPKKKPKTLKIKNT